MHVICTRIVFIWLSSSKPLNLILNFMHWKGKHLQPKNMNWNMWCIGNKVRLTLLHFNKHAIHVFLKMEHHYISKKMYIFSLRIPAQPHIMHFARFLFGIIKHNNNVWNYSINMAIKVYISRVMMIMTRLVQFLWQTTSLFPPPNHKFFYYHSISLHNIITVVQDSGHRVNLQHV